MNNINTKYTVTLPSDYVKDLKELSAKKIIPSVNYGIKRAVEKYLAQTKKEIYETSMAEAVKDEAFLKRTLDTQKDFNNVDCEVGGEW
jgi:metal-responsive CopG/Arc/MetJ family transcriptional regulator